MAEGITVDPADLASFARGIREVLLPDLRPGLERNLKLAGGSALGEQYPSFGSAGKLADRYALRMADLNANLKALLTALNTLADAADAIARNYRDARDVELVDAKAVDSVFASLPAAPPSTQATL